MSDQIFWYVTRSSALVAWMTASLSVLVGLMTSSRALGRRPSIPWLVDFHRLLAAMSVSFLGIHMLSLWFDGYVKFGWAELAIPWVATVPGLTRTSIALGVIAAWLLAAVQVSSLIRNRLPEDVWRTIHMLSFGTLGAGTLHAIQTGSDSDNPLVLALGFSTLTAIGLAGAVRVVRLRQAEAAPPTVTTPGPGGSSPTAGRPTGPGGPAVPAGPRGPGQPAGPGGRSGSGRQAGPPPNTGPAQLGRLNQPGRSNQLGRLNQPKRPGQPGRSGQPGGPGGRSGPGQQAGPRGNARPGQQAEPWRNAGPGQQAGPRRNAEPGHQAERSRPGGPAGRSGTGPTTS